MQNSGIAVAAILVSMFAGPSRAQNAPPAESGAAIRVTSTEVVLDLTVRDKHGKQVKNLKPADVEIYEDGLPQKILSFRQVGAREALHQQAGSDSKPTQTSTGSRPLRAVNAICIVFHNLDPLSRTRATQAVQEFVRDNLPPGAYAGVFNLGDRLTPVFPFTNNHAELLQAAQTAFNGRALDFGRASEALLTANPTQSTVLVAVSGHSATATQQINGGEIDKTVITGADVSTDRGAGILRGDQVRERGDFSNINGMRGTDQIITMINNLGTLPGRKVVLLLTTGLMTTGDPDRFQSILNNASKAGITVYAQDVSGLSETSTAKAADVALGQVASVSRTQSAVNSDLSAMRQKSRQEDTMNDAVRSSDSQSSLRALSEGTGGFLIANTNDYRKPYQHLVDDLEAHYEAVYRPASDKYDGRLRKIEVKLARADLQADSRSGYFALPDLQGSTALQAYETLGLALLSSQPAPHAFDFHSASFHFQNSGAGTQNALAFELPGVSLVHASDPARKTNRFHVSLVALVKDAGGQVVDKYSIDAPYEIPEASLQAVQASNLTYTHPVNLPSGHYTVETAVLDREGGRSSVTVFPLDAPEPRKEVGLSSLVLVQSLEPVSGPAAASSDPLVYRGKRIVPMVGANLNAGAKPYVYFAVYPNQANAGKPKIQVEFLAGDKVVANQTADLPAPDPSGAIPMFVTAPTRPGNCELKITAVQGSETSTQSVKYSVAEK